ncbi:MAG: tyrosine-type recombinase/integrase [Proteobacteria bacterium]|nr:tyrosine-type recombinase/integrase [Pseudomonadota bacterium]MDA1294027.1 tyrosine-type recombinase/integrase [Pseudomonadota bacterium]
MSTQIKYATKRHNTWVYRRTYPKHLQPLLGSSLKQSLKTADAKIAKARVAELNQTYQSIIKEAEQHVSANTDQTTADIPNTCGAPADPRPRIERPRYQPLRLLGDRCIAELAQSYLSYQSERLRPGSYKAVRFAVELLVSHLGKAKVGDITQVQGREVLSLITQLSPNVRKYREGQRAGLSELVKLSKLVEPYRILAPQTQGRIWKHMLQFLDWCVEQGELSNNLWEHLTIREKPEVYPHKVLTDDQVAALLKAKDRVLSSALLFGLLTGMRSGEICGLMASDVISKGNLGRFIRIQPNAFRQLKSKAAEREVPLHQVLEQSLDTSLPRQGRLFPTLTVDRVVKAYAKLRQAYPELTGTVFHSTRKWFITQCERTGVPEHYTASLVGHHTARSANKLTYALYSAGISDAQKRSIIDGIRVPEGVL